MQTITGTATAPTIMKRIPVKWTLDTKTMEVHANESHAGRVIESIPGKLYYFSSPSDSEYNTLNPASFGNVEAAAAWGAVRQILIENR